jgi:hypothetical protein
MTEGGGVIPNVPGKWVWLDIPDTCRMRGEFTGDHDIQISFGDPKDGANVLFERVALERFVRLASDLLSASIPADSKADLPTLHAPDI